MYAYVCVLLCHSEFDCLAIFIINHVSYAEQTDIAFFFLSPFHFFGMWMNFIWCSLIISRSGCPHIYKTEEEQKRQSNGEKKKKIRRLNGQKSKSSSSSNSSTKWNEWLGIKEWSLRATSRSETTHADL